MWEDADSAIDYESNAESVARYIHTYNVYGLGGRAAGYYQSGCLPGVETWAESRTDGVDWVALFNRRPPCLSPSTPVIATLESLFDRGV